MKLHWLEHKRKIAQKAADEAANKDNISEAFWLGYVAALKDCYRQQSKENLQKQRSW